MNFSVPHQLDDLRGELGQPSTFPIVGRGVPSLLTGYQFPCGCKAIPADDNGLYALSVPCPKHYVEPTGVRVSDRRRKRLSTEPLSYDAVGLLTWLISAQEGAPLDNGCAAVEHDESEIPWSKESVRHLVNARILDQAANGKYRLLAFNCWDAEAGEWY
ncbi:MAG: hypothetical protein JO225_00135 [Candidatus Eremiobacteraeota bacterium]|nr:hypothetical protein [Candidatus Eremiobacteraeota bacterium]